MPGPGRKQLTFIVVALVGFGATLWYMNRGLAGARAEQRARLVEGLADPSGRVRAAAAAGLGALGEGGALADLRPALSDPAPTVRVAGAWATWRLGDSAGAKAALVEALGHRDALVRRAAVESLRRLEDPATAPLLKLALGDLEPGIRTDAALGLVRINDAAGFDALEQTLADPRPTHRVAGAVALARIDDPRARAAAHRAAEAGVAPAAAMAAVVMQRWGEGRESRPILARALKEGPLALRISICDGLGLLGGPDARSLLQGVADGVGSDPGLRRAAIAGLNRLRGARSR